MKSNLKIALSFFLFSLYEINKNRKRIILLLLIPLSEIKALFYESELKVSWYLFSDNKKYLCNVLEDYSNVIIIGVVFYYFLFVKKDLNTLRLVFFLFIINALDGLFIGLMDNYFYLLKPFMASIIYSYGIRKVSFQCI